MNRKHQKYASKQTVSCEGQAYIVELCQSLNIVYGMTCMHTLLLQTLNRFVNNWWQNNYNLYVEEEKLDGLLPVD